MATGNSTSLDLAVDGIKNNDSNNLTSNIVQLANKELNEIMETLRLSREDVKPLLQALIYAEDENWRKMNGVKNGALLKYKWLKTELQKMRGGEKTKSDLKIKTTANSEYAQKETQAHSQPNNVKTRHYGTKEGSNNSDLSVQEQLKKKDKEVSVLRNRLSQFAGDKLRDGNASFADLSDINRPTNLAGYFSELYDNEWTDAFEYLQNRGSHDEKADVKSLADVLMYAFNYTREIAERQRARLMQSILHPSSTDVSITKGSKIKSGENHSIGIMVKQIQKDSTELAMKDLKIDFLPRLEAKTQSNPSFSKYIEKCLQLTWLFNIQDPPLWLHWDQEGDVRKNHLRAFTKEGTHIDYQVWPTLLLHLDGPALSKGIAQFR